MHVMLFYSLLLASSYCPPPHPPHPPHPHCQYERPPRQYQGQGPAWEGGGSHRGKDPTGLCRLGGTTLV